MSQQFSFKESPSLNKINQMSLQKISTTERDALTAAEKIVGMLIYNTTTARNERWDGTNWVAWSG